MVDGGPVLFRQERVGLNLRPFPVVKFRTMALDAEERLPELLEQNVLSGHAFKLDDDPRLTRTGRFLRRTRLDELPQFWNILIGNMSLVGPRPERPEFVQSLIQQIPFYGQRHVIKPGLTGWAQVRYSYGASVEDALEKLQYDLFYVKNRTLALDLFIIAKTVKTVLMRKGGQ